MTEHNNTSLNIRVADWHTDSAALQHIRKTVFVEEQHVPVELEWDEYDASSTHFLVELDDRPVATARVKPDGQLGRMAVLADYRNRGIGRALLDAVIDYCEQTGMRTLSCHAQIQVTGFYEQAGFVQHGEIFEDAGIEHRAMLRKCAK